MNGELDADKGGYSQAFLQGNYTGCGNETDGTVDGSGPNGGGSEIDGIYIAKDRGQFLVFQTAIDAPELLVAAMAAHPKPK